LSEKYTQGAREEAGRILDTLLACNIPRREDVVPPVHTQTSTGRQQSMMQGRMRREDWKARKQLESGLLWAGRE